MERPPESDPEFRSSPLIPQQDLSYSPTVDLKISPSQKRVNPFYLEDHLSSSSAKKVGQPLTLAAGVPHPQHPRLQAIPEEAGPRFESLRAGLP